MLAHRSGDRGNNLVAMRINRTIESTSRASGNAALLSSAAYFDAKYENTHTPRLTDRTKSLNWNMNRVQSGQQRRLRHQQPARIRVYRDMFKLDYPDSLNGRKDKASWSGGTPVEKFEESFGGVIGISIPRAGISKRGVISGFSRSSRKRMIELMARIRESGDMYFVTMTYDDDSWLRSGGNHQVDFEAFRRRFERQFPTFKAIWRLEIKERLSGTLIGQQVPHFHLLIWTNRSDSDAWKEAFAESLQAWGVLAWGAILGTAHPDFERYGFHVGQVRSRKHAASYVSKYLAKCDEDNLPCGRRWGRIGKFNTSCSEIVLLTDDETIELRRLVKRWLRNRNANFSRRFAKLSTQKGFTVFGLGDSFENGTMTLCSGGLWQFVDTVKRYTREREQRESGVGS